ncbi:hypothetical protein [Arthrobacter sp. NPDC056493]|uniref:hypothetical protein n=1 Tax=Arthrobacter sp. NPDC056493 TaxID=3345839 RepID=UPI00366F4984
MGMLSRPVATLAAMPLSTVMALAAAGCTAGQSAPSTSESASLPGNIPANLWNAGSPDPLRPVGIAGLKPTEPLVATSYDAGTDTIGDWRLMDMNDDRTKLVIQYSQGGPCATAKGILTAETSTAVALVPLYQNGPATPYAAVLSTPVSTVTLDEPLGDRELLHLADHGTMQSPTPAPTR